MTERSSPAGSQPPAPFDIASRARELFAQIAQMFNADAARLLVERTLREAHAAGAMEKAEEIADSLRVQAKHERDGRSACGYERGAALDAAAERIRCSHARPPQPAPETTEERYRKALEEIVTLRENGFGWGIANEALGGGA